MSRLFPGGSAPASARRLYLVAIIALALALCLVLTRSSPRFASTAGSSPTLEPVHVAATTEERLAQAQIPPRDPYDLAARLRYHAETPLPIPTARSYHPGDQETFWVLNLRSAESFEVSATLRHMSDHLNMWVRDGIEIAQEALERSAQTFDERLYPTVRRYFGAEWSPGIDQDERLTVLHAQFAGAVGYFSSSDEYPATIAPYSNQRDMFYINPDLEMPGSASYDATLTHEFQHMVHWFGDSNEDAWVTEGASELAMHLCGYPRDSLAQLFAQGPDIQLTTWSDDDLPRHYAASFLFMAYFAERFGPQMTNELVSEDLNGAAGFEAVLEANNTGLSFEDLFADWLIANYLDAEASVTGSTPYSYQQLEIQTEVEQHITAYPSQGAGQVHHYAADYLELAPTTEGVRLDFAAAAAASLIPNQPRSGRYQWWSNRGDNSDMTLTRRFDLSSLEKASLEAWLWYDIEDGWDYAYVEVSADGGATWHILSDRHSMTENPRGDSYGPGYTGTSHADSAPSPSPQWVQKTFDLSPFAGQEVLVRFEYLTDEAVNGPGFCVDDIRIPELGYSHDVEAGEDGWIAHGFVRSENHVPQRYILQLIRMPNHITAPPMRCTTSKSPGYGSDEECLAQDRVTIQRLLLSTAQSATWTLRGLGDDIRKAVLVIAAVSSGSDAVADYRYELSLEQ